MVYLRIGVGLAIENTEIVHGALAKSLIKLSMAVEITVSVDSFFNSWLENKPNHGRAPSRKEKEYFGTDKLILEHLSAIRNKNNF